MVHHLIVPPSDLRNILLDVKNETHSHSRLAPSDIPDVNIWAHYSVMPVFPNVTEEFFIGILSISLIGISLQMHLYRVYNLPALHLDL